VAATVLALAPAGAVRAADGEPAPATEETVSTQIAVLPAEPIETPVTAEPVEPVHRPRGLWAPLAVAADVLVMRPIGLVSLAAGSALFVAVSPVAAATCTLDDRADTLLDRAKNVFTRPIGAL
jgi:hypothetical protein